MYPVLGLRIAKPLTGADSVAQGSQGWSTGFDIESLTDSSFYLVLSLSLSLNYFSHQQTVYHSSTVMNSLFNYKYRFSSIVFTTTRW